jgi:hypothetical protein
MTDIVSKLYYPVIPKSEIPRFVELLRAGGMDAPPEAEEAIDFGVADDLVAARVDCAAVVERKYAALAAHGSQADNTFFLALGPEVFANVFSTEFFVRKMDRTGNPVPEDDLFAGLR